MLVGHLSIFLGEMSIQVVCSFFKWVVGLFAVELYKLLVYFRNYAQSDVQTGGLAGLGG